MKTKLLQLIDTKKFFSATFLKTLAIIAMTIDHIAYLIVPSWSTLYVVMRLIGRMTAPIMFFLIVEGYHKTKNFKKYLFRIFIFALISQIFKTYFTYGSIKLDNIFLSINIMFTMFIGLLVISRLRRIEDNIFKIFFLISILFLSQKLEYGIWGVLIIVAFDHFYTSRNKQVLSYIIIIILKLIVDILCFPNRSLVFTVGMLYPIILIFLYNGERGKSGKVAKWFFYIYYPLHLFIIAFIYYKIILKY